jgi:CheY-like chemotaxis protein
MKILIVDDSRAMQTIVQRGIEQLGYSTIELKKANNGAEALDIVRVWEPNLVISDWHMPEMNGFELLAALNREMLDIKIGFVTTESSEQKLQAALDAGAQFIVQKPFDSKTLHEAVLPIIQGSTEGEKLLNEHQHKIIEKVSNHILLPGINGFKKTLNALAKISVDIQPAPPIILDEKRYPYLLGLYGSQDKQSVHAIAIADINAACILGALNGRIREEDVHIALAEKALPKAIIDNCQGALRTLETLLINTQQKQHLSLRSSNLMRKPNPNINKLLIKNSNNRLDVQLKILEHDAGHFTFIVS